MSAFEEKRRKWKRRGYRGLGDRKERGRREKERVWR